MLVELIPVPNELIFLFNLVHKVRVEQFAVRIVLDILFLSTVFLGLVSFLEFLPAAHEMT
jgi:hypothetical protein